MRANQAVIGSAITAMLLVSSTSAQQVSDPNLLVEPVATGFTNPTGMTFVAPDRFLVTEQNTGKIKVVVNGVVQAALALDLPVPSGLEPGLLSIVKHPDFPTVPYIYVYYTRSTVDGGPRLGNRISRFTWNGESLDPASEMIVHTLPSDNAGHHGGIVAFGLDGTMFAVIGDQHLNEQSTNFPTGGPHEVACVVRFNQDGSVASGNPFGAAGWRYIYAYGIRNSFGIAVDPLTGHLWQSENGLAPGEEEVNLLLPGTNSGWEDTFGHTNPPPAGLFVVPGSFYSNPEFEFGVTAAPTSVTFITSPVLGASYWHDMLVAEGHFSANHRIFRFELNEARDALSFTVPGLQDLHGASYAEMASLVFADGFGIITDVEVGPDGFLYVVDRASGANGKVLRIRPNHPTGDVDRDGDLDLADAAQLQRCFSGANPANPPTQECRDAVDIDEDDDVDAADYAAFHAQHSGPLFLL